MSGPIAAPREAEGHQVDELYQHDAVHSRAMACTPGRGTPLLSPRNPRPFTLPVLNKATKTAHFHMFF